MIAVLFAALAGTPTARPTEGRGPDFFVVGAPKCGTTALDHYLAAHPNVFMAPQKESHHFATDLTRPDDKYRSREVYLQLFKGAGGAQRVGESSVMYLYSEVAARQIHAYRPDAQIIVMLRDPVTMIPSLHSENIFNGHETELDLERALAAEPQRRAAIGQRTKHRIPQRILYREVADYAPQLARYFDTFGREHVHVILYENFAADPAETYRRVLDFLGLDSAFQPDFRVVNANKAPRSRVLTSLLNRPPPWLRRAWRALGLPLEVQRALIRRTLDLNVREEPRRPLDAELAKRLRRELAPSVEKLGVLLGQDLSSWPTGSA
jgi:hypothetical protein